MSDVAHLDYEQLESLLEFLPLEKVRALLFSGMRGAQPLVDAMLGAISGGDAETLYRSGHTAKGMFGNLGMRRCEDLSRKIEVSGKAEDFASASTALADLQIAIEETNAMLIQWIDSK